MATILYPLLLTLCLLGCVKGCVQSERLALLDFKKSFPSSPQNHGKLSSWNSSEDTKDCCSWEGITCNDPAGHVESLDLSFQGLESYRLRPSVLELQHLKSLDLRENNLDMRIPEFIGSLSKLTALDISDAGFFGMIPPQLGNLSNLQTLSIGSSSLSAHNFQWLSHLSSLETLDMSSTNISEARDWLFEIRKLPVLSDFTCTSCYFPTPDFPSTFSNHFNSSSSLQTLTITDSILSYTSLSLLINSTSNLSMLDMESLNLEAPFGNIFDAIGKLCNLEELFASGCSMKMRLVDIIQPLASCASNSLQFLDLSLNNLTGTIPPMLKFQSLGGLNLYGNRLESFAPQISTLSSGNVTNSTIMNTSRLFPASLSELSISRNTLSGILSNEYFTNFSQLSTLDLDDNPNLRISFNVPLTRLRELGLSSCNLGPKFPNWLLALDSISQLDISHCKIFGSIPIAFWKNLPPSLGYFNISFNNLHGVVPNLPFEFYGVYPFTVTIDLTSNSFHGPIPPLFFQANELYLSKNRFSSFAPPPYSNNNNISDFYSTSIVDISGNNLSGEIPQWLWSQSWMNSLNLANNNLSGILPSSTNASNMYALNLSNNSFSGPLPSLLKNCTNIRIVDLSRNEFSGLIPSWLGEGLNSLDVLSLQSNNFTGTPPSNLFNLSSLKILDLSHNKLSGNIPSCVDKLFAMVHHVNSSTGILLPGSRNAMSTVPVDEVDFYHAFVKWKGMDRLFQKNLEMVRLVDLSNNNFSGEIPTQLTSLMELDSLDLSSNNLEGSIPNQIGQLKSLEYLNLSYNKLSGPIPPSLSDISLLGMLDLSHNNLSGRIPKGTQLQGFDSSAYQGNPELCGLPLQVKCPGDVDDSATALQPSAIYESDSKEDKWTDKQSFYAGLGAGFACGFFGILGSLVWITKWRYAFFHIATRVGEWILLVVALSTSKINRKLWLK